eukprot:TRINITY_DN14780_c0_g1_i1.p1 TRINITY_DN14780_c0_g1~~TRINITY_DN14780_c0_g1_i1.p1  ORF type:complete len:508 (+),score=79.25 TRINITY_DN14780_c0_g1_i1:101-1624(+)
MISSGKRNSLRSRAGRSGAHGSSSHPKNRSFFFACYRQCQTCLWLLLILVLISNFLLFFAGNVAYVERQTSEAAEEELAPMWNSDLQGPPDGLTCESWLSESDALKESDTRDYVKASVSVRAHEERQWRDCSVGCVFSKHFGVRENDCDADITGERSSCSFRVVQQEAPGEKVLLPNDTNVLAMTTSLDSDVPIWHPSWAEYSFMNPVAPKSAKSPVVAILNSDCRNMQPRLDLISEFRRLGVAVDLYGKCFQNRTIMRLRQQDIMSRYRFALVFEGLVNQDYMSPDYWSTLAGGTVPIVASASSLSKFVPADNSFLQVQKADDVSKVVEWVNYLVKFNEAYAEMLRWKDDWPSDFFLALVDLNVVRPECRLCIHLATLDAQMREAEQQWPCRCSEASSNSTVYHIFIRERGRFAFEHFFLRSTELTVTALIRSVYHLFKGKSHQPIWREHRPDSLSGAVLLRAFRIYPVAASQDMALQGYAAFRTDDQLRNFVEATPCPKLEVIFL